MRKALEDAIKTLVALPPPVWPGDENDAAGMAALTVLVGEWDRIVRRRERAGEQVAVDPRRPVADPWTEKAGYAAVDERSGGHCEAEGCPRPGSHHHHLAGRRGDDPHHPDNLLLLCQPCHTWAHDHPAEAAKAGLMRSRLGVR